MIKKLRLKIIINRLKKYLKKFFFKLGYEDMTKIEFKKLKNGEYVVRADKGVYNIKLVDLGSRSFEVYITLLKNEEVEEIISFDVTTLGKLNLKVDIRPKRYEIVLKTKKQIIDLISRKTVICFFRFKHERENNSRYECDKPLIESKIIDVRKLINVAKKAKKE
jgi:hypothetical protein